MPKIPQLVTFTNLALPGQPVSPISVRSDMVIIVERTSVKMEEQPVPGVRVAKSGPALGTGAPVAGTCLHLAGGGRLFVEESVEEVTASIQRATRGGWFK